MRIGVSSTALAAAAAIVLAFAAVDKVAAKSKSKSTQTEADWISFDPETEQVTVKVRDPGKGKDAKMLHKGKEAVFKVKAEGSVLTRTVVKVNGKAGKLSDIPAGKRVLIYWQPKDGTPHARSIDVVFTEEELNERFPDSD